MADGPNDARPYFNSGYRGKMPAHMVALVDLDGNPYVAGGGSGGGGGGDMTPVVNAVNANKASTDAVKASVDGMSEKIDGLEVQVYATTQAVQNVWDTLRAKPVANDYSGSFDIPENYGTPQATAPVQILPVNALRTYADLINTSASRQWFRIVVNPDDVAEVPQIGSAEIGGGSANGGQDAVAPIPAIGSILLNPGDTVRIKVTNAVSLVTNNDGVSDTVYLPTTYAVLEV